MSYIKFNDDPLAKRTSAAFANLCATDPKKKILKLLDRCFSIFNGSKKEASFCELENFIYPVDSSLSIDFEVCAGETLVVFDNHTDDNTTDTSDSIYNVTPSSYPGAPSNYPLTSEGIEEYIDYTLDPSNTPIYYVIANDRNYVRGCILYVKYPTKDKNGDDILPADYECKIKFTNRLFETFEVPLHQFFAHFANPETRGADSLINKLEIYNPNSKFSIKVTGLVIYTKSNTDPSDCAC